MRLKQFKKIIITLLFVLAFMVMIFIFSSQNNNESDTVSGFFTRIVIKIMKFIGNLIPKNGDETVIIDPNYSLFDDINHYVRKLAHMTEYALLGGALTFHLDAVWEYLSKILAKRHLLIALLISIFYASTDEFHQLFVSGRGASVKDVIIDGVGAVCGILVAYLIVIRIRKSKNRMNGGEYAED